jgi:hypothetical protein
MRVEVGVWSLVVFLFWSECGLVGGREKIVAKLGAIFLSGCLFNVYIRCGMFLLGWM